MSPPHPLRRRLPPAATVDHWPAADGWPIRRLGWPADGDPAGAILFLGGRGDIFEKYLESFAHWHDRGWSVTALDWRGHGGSGRLTPDGAVGHLASFDTLVTDLTAFWHAWTEPVPRVVMGHSMGGNIVLRALLARAIDPAAAVLLSPTVAIRSPLGGWLTERLVRWQARRGDPGRPAWSARDTPASRLDAGAMLTGDSGRLLDEDWWHERMPELRLGPPSWGWLAAAIASGRRLGAGDWRGLATPLLFLAASDDRLTDTRATRRLADRIGPAELICFPRGVGHELLRERDAVRTAALAAIDRVLDAAAGDQPGRSA